MSLMAASQDVLKEVRLPTAPHRHPLREATLLHLQTTGPLRLQVKVHPLVRMVLGLVAPVDSVAPVVVVLDWEALASVDLVAAVDWVVREWARVAAVARVVRAWARVVRAWDREVRVWDREVRAWDRVVRACAVAHHRKGWPNEPSVSIATATVN